MYELQSKMSVSFNFLMTSLHLERGKKGALSYALVLAHIGLADVLIFVYT